MRAVAVLLLAFAAPASAQVCIGGASQAHQHSAGFVTTQGIGQEGSSYGGEFAGSGDDVAVVLGVQWADEEVNDETPFRVGVEAAYTGLGTLCPVLRVGSGQVGGVNTLDLGVGLGLGTMVAPTVGLFGGTQLARAWANQIPGDWYWMGSAGAGLYLGAFEATAELEADLSDLGETAALRLGLRAVIP